MDGSLVRTSTEKGGMDRMGASWVQIGLDKKEILDTGYVVRLKEIHLSLVKVKSHSGILWNEIADHLARQ
ncbi:43407_t:CDS:2, partial [Gigaspora margarita]